MGFGSPIGSQIGPDGHPNWGGKHVRKQSKNGVENGMPFCIDVLQLLIDFGCQIGGQNPFKIEPKKRRKNKDTGKQNQSRVGETGGFTRSVRREPSRTLASSARNTLEGLGTVFLGTPFLDVFFNGFFVFLAAN